MPDAATQQLQADVVIIGGGPAGIAAACVVSESGAKTLLLDNMPSPGGNIWRGKSGHAPKGSAGQWLERLSRCKANILSNTTVYAAPGANTLLAETLSPQGPQIHQIHWQKLILATGARELFLPFPGWTLPNVLGVGGLQALSKTGWPVKNKRVVVAGSGPLLLAAAAQFRELGATIPLIAEQAPMDNLINFGLILPFTAPSKIVQAIGLKWKLLGVPFKTGTWVAEAHGNEKLDSVTVTNGTKSRQIPCDFLACSYSLLPSLELPLLFGCQITKARTVVVKEFQETTIPNIYCAGEPNGIGGVDSSLLEGQIAGLAAAGKQDRAKALHSPSHRANKFRDALAHTFALRPELKKLAQPDTLICRCEDVSRARLENFPTFRAAKLHTRCGMGACQGRICGGAVQFLYNWESASIRPPVLPVSVGALAVSGSASDQGG
jgi:D-hydroxyproline dehydrogenase subunit alpha